MASVNKVSLWEDFASLKAQFERLRAGGKVAAEDLALVQSLLMLFELLMEVFMGKHNAKASRTSSLSPSQSEKEVDTATRSGTQTKGQGHTHSRSSNIRTVETVTVLPVDTCAHCGAELSDLPPADHERCTHIDTEGPLRDPGQPSRRRDQSLPPLQMPPAVNNPLVAIQMALSGELSSLGE